MWTRADLKSRAKDVLRRNYWMPFAVSLLWMFLAGGSGAGSGSTGSTVGNTVNQQSAGGQIAPEVVAIVVITAILVFVVAFAIAFAVSYFVSGPITMGKHRFYMENRDADAPFGKLFYLFKNNYLRVSGAYFVTQLFIGLWSLLFIIPGIVYSYKWYMVPYILAENPRLSGARAREISDRMTMGQKWDIWVLQLSFFGWQLLGALCCGVGAFFVQPYVDATFAELYATMRRDALDNGWATAEELPGFAE